MAYYYPHQLDAALTQHPDFKEAFDRLTYDSETDAQQSYWQGFDDGVENEKFFGRNRGFEEGVKHAAREARQYARERRGIGQAASRMDRLRINLREKG
jgi:hypothetical protein